MEDNSQLDNKNDKPTEPDATATDTDLANNTEELETLRTTNATYEKVLKAIFGVAESELLGDVNEHLSIYNSNLEAKNTAVNDRIITAEIKALQGYDTKLLAKVIDRSNIKVAEDGTVTGLAEAVKTASTEYPAVVVKENKESYAPYHPADTKQTTQLTMNDIIRRKRSN